MHRHFSYFIRFFFFFFFFFLSFLSFNTSFVNARGNYTFRKSNHATLHEGCLTADWRKDNQTIAMSNRLIQWLDHSFLMQFIKKSLDVVALPVPIQLNLRKKFFGHLYDLSLNVDTLRVAGMQSIEIIPLQALNATAIETGVYVQALRLELMIDLQYGKKTQRRFGFHICPGSTTFFGRCKVNAAMIKVTLDIHALDVRLLFDLWVYDYCHHHPHQRRRKNKYFHQAQCKIRSAWGYVRHLFLAPHNVLNGVQETLYERIHDAHARYGSVAFQKFDLDLHIESQFGILLDPHIFTYLHTIMNAEFNHGLFHDSITKRLAVAARNAANAAIDSIRHKFNAKHITTIE